MDFSATALYVDLHGLAPTLARLRAQLGNDEKLPDQPQRLEIFQPMFGSHDDASMNGNASFPFLRDNLNQAAAAFSERVFDTGVEMLRERVRTTHRPSRNILRD